MSDFYNGSKLLNLKDLNGKDPEIFICTSNRNAGKTTYFGKYLLNRYIKHGEKFALLYRYDYDLEGVAERFFSNIQELFFPDREMIGRSAGEGKYTEMFLDGESCGYALALNNAKYYRQFSQYFSDIVRILFDEFQPEDSSDYIRNEITKFRSIHVSVARGMGKQVRHVPVILCGNPYSIINPYYSALGISTRLTKETKFLRGNGWVMEQGFNQAAAAAAKQSGFNAAFENHSYFDNIGAGEFLNDINTFIESPSGRNHYICTLKYKNKYYGVRSFDDAGIVFCDTRSDQSFPFRIAVTTNDMTPNYISIKQNRLLVQMLKKYFHNGMFRFRNLECKQAVFALLSISE